ncbi:uncharacterized protein KIAA1143 homolog [Lineus longissimus]|uniref:uncharacterized protein KIAA1143 homolog n=1 Tax=Lineus longissimus TaxID=88925 RepID=UPI002B4CC504
MSKRNAVSYIKQDEPSFLKQFKEKVGYVEGPNVDTKREIQPPGDDDSDEDRPDAEDEKPQIVVLKKGDMTAEEVEKMEKEEEKEGNSFEIDVGLEEPNDAPKDGKITFKKPTKRSSDESSDLVTSSFKKKKEEKTKEQNTSKATKNSSLLSFGDDEEEEDSDE